ncbi:MAG: LCP family protein [Patescibacteria group bacterium]|jgi:LCP family protein required for cell wall assembly
MTDLKNTPPLSDEEKGADIAAPEYAKKKKWPKRAVYFLIFLGISVAFFFSQAIISDRSSYSWIKRMPIVKQFNTLVEGADKKLKGEDEDRVNILLLGMGGKGHDGAYLTDTIMLASLKPSEGKVFLLSIPRDLVVPVEGQGWRKINSINSFAEAKEPGSGGQATADAIGDLLDLPIHYYLRVDFEGFMKIVDELGGINVYVENTLDDYSYPVLGNEDAAWNSRYEHLHVDTGWQEMDGSLALKFSRSRHAYGSEGSDFARARRQQKVIEAVKDKALSLNMVFKPMAIKNIIDALNEHVSTSFEIWEIYKFYDLAKNISKENISNKVLDTSAEGLLVNGTGQDGAYILSPRSGDFAEIQYLAKSAFSAPSTVESEKVSVEKTTIEVKNGTWINGLAGQASVDLERYGFVVTKISNSSRQNFQKSVIYDLTFGEKKESLQMLKEKTGANVSFNLPDWLTEELKTENENKANTTPPDFILILGTDANK